MSSLIEGYPYDLFISYRHNDNRSGWVTEFVNALQEELASTIKEPLSIYFDKNPHDGLLETHNVDKSLEGKLKCLIFIPIISQTYCDPKSFAWQHEFCAFNKLAQEDQFGKDITLRNGNVTSRILPIKIHDLDEEDKSIIENEMGGALRSIEFIYKEPGVNRPLKIYDDRTINQHKTDFRNQVNKVALAVKELLQALKNTALNPQNVSSKPPDVAPKRKQGWIVLTFLILIFAAFTIYYLQGKPETTKNKFDQSLDRAEKYLLESERYGDQRYKDNALQAIQKVLTEDSLHERALYLMAFVKEDTTGYYFNKILKSNPNSKYGLLGKATQLVAKMKWTEAREMLIHVLQIDPENKDALSILAYVSLATQDYLNCWKYANRHEEVTGEGLHEILSAMFLELGDFSLARYHLNLKQENKEFACQDIESMQRILLCEGDFDKLEKMTDSVCQVSKCSDCSFWQLRSKAHVGKFGEAASYTGTSLAKMPKITWRLPAFVLLKTGKRDSAQLIAEEEIKFDKSRLADTAYTQAIPLYSLASIHAMFGNSKESLTWLRRYADKGFEMGSEWYIAHDPLFDDLQKDPEFFADFIQIIQKAQARKNALREELRTLEKSLK